MGLNLADYLTDIFVFVTYCFLLGVAMRLGWGLAGIFFKD